MINNADVPVSLHAWAELDAQFSLSVNCTISLYIMFHSEINLFHLTYSHPDANCLQATDEVAYCDYNHR